MANQVAKRPDTQVATAQQGASLLQKFGARYSVDPAKLLATLKGTCFKDAASDEQMISLLIVADQYHLNPFTREIYAFVDPRTKGIVPIIGVDGWLRIINTHPQFDYMELAYSDDGEEEIWTQCAIFRKDRPSPTVIREYMEECKRDTGPWKSHPRRMLRHKAIIQAARVAFGFVGIYDPDEGERVVAVMDVPSGKPKTATPQALAQPAPAENPKITQDQAVAIRDRLEAEGIAVSHFCARYEIGRPEELEAALYDAAGEWIDEESKAA